MQWVHEAGHVLAALATGGEVDHVVLHPLLISRTDLRANPRPLIVTWAGPISGVLAPLAMWLLARGVHLRSESLFRFFAGFCCVANGAYIGLGSFDAVGDCGELLKHGASLWQLWVFGAVHVGGGLLLWHGLGRHFGQARDHLGRHAFILALLLASLVTAGVLLTRSE